MVFALSSFKFNFLMSQDYCEFQKFENLSRVMWSLALESRPCISLILNLLAWS